MATTNKRTAFDKLLGHEIAKHGLGVGVYKITPDIAAALLTDPACQIDFENDDMRDRGTSDRRVDHYAQIMLDGNWRLNGEALIFDQQYRRLNGKHRLKAVVKSKVTIQSLVIWNLPTDVFSTIDRGKLRTDRDVAHIVGIKSANAMVPMANWICKYHTNRALDRTAAFDNVEAMTTWLMAKEESIAPSMSYSASARGSKARFRLLPQSLLAALHHLTQTNEAPEVTEKFWDQFTTGVGVEEGSPVLLLRRVLENYNSPTSRTPDYIKMAVTIKAYNHFVQGTTIKQLVFRPGQDVFPSIVWNPPLGEGRF